MRHTHFGYMQFVCSAADWAVDEAVDVAPIHYKRANIRLQKKGSGPLNVVKPVYVETAKSTARQSSDDTREPTQS